MHIENDNVSRETIDDDPLNFVDTPIAAAAKRASEITTGYNLPNLPKPQKTRIIAVSNQKGGVGKTTSTVNLAMSLAILGQKVLVIDLDPQGNASTALNIEHTPGVESMYQVILGEISLDKALKNSSHNENLWCIPANLELAGVEIELVGMDNRENRLKNAFSSPEFLAKKFDYIFIDCPPSLGLLTINAMVAATEVLIPIQCEYYALEGVGQLIHSIDLVKNNLNKELNLSTILLTMYDSRTNLSNQVAEEVTDYFGNLVIKTKIPRSVKVSEAPSFAKTIINYDPGSKGASSYIEAAKELAARS